MEHLLSILLAAVVPAQQSNLPTPPVLEVVPQPDSDEARRGLAAEQHAALERVARSRRHVTRAFAVGWEMHHGLYLVSDRARNWLTAKWVTPDFVDGKLRDRLADAASGGPSMRAHVGQKLLCRCTGVEWTFYGQKRFLIRHADLVWK